MSDATGSLQGVRIGQLIESDGPGGAERMVADLSVALRDDGAQVVAFLPTGCEGWLTRELTTGGVVVQHYPPGGPLSGETQHAIAHGLHRHRVSVLHSHEFSMAVAGSWAARRLEIPHVITMHGSRYYAGRMRRKLGMRMAATLSVATVAVSDDLAHDLRHDLWLGKNVVTTIPNGLRSRKAGSPPRLRAELRLDAGDRLVLAVGNLYPVKGHRDLLEAIALLPPPFDCTHVAIAGRGELAEALLAHAADLGVSDRVHLLGLRADIPELLAAADVFALPSHSEGLSIALLEAMDAALPIVATDVGDTRVALDDGGAGLVVGPHDPAGLSASLRLLLEDPARAAALGARAAHRARAFYSHRVMVQRYRRVYRRAVGSAFPLDRPFTPPTARAELAPGR